MKAHVLLEGDVNKKYLTYVTELDDQVESLLQGKATLVFESGTVGLSPLDILRMVGECPLNDSRDVVLRNVLINSLLSSENLWSGSGIITGITFLEASKEMIRQKHLLNRAPSKEIDPVISNISRLSRRCSSTDALKLYQGLEWDKTSLFAVEKISQLSGADGQINFIRRPSSSSYISIKDGYTFSKCHPPEIFRSECSKRSWSRSNPKIFIVDGIIESVSEIHQILDGSSRQNVPCVIVARGFSDDVQNTLAVNMSYGRLDVYPIVVAVDEIGANQMFDISAVCAADTVSSLKGEVISSKKFDDIKSVELIDISELGMTIHNNATRNMVTQRRKSLTQKMSNIGTEHGFETAEFQRNIYGERIRSLTDKGVDIHIGSNFGSKSGMTRDRIEMGVRLYRDVCRHGMIDLKDIKNVPSYVSSAIERLTSYNISKMSAPGLLAGIKIGYQTALTCSKIGAWIVCDED